MNRRLLVVAPAFPPHPSPATHRARWIARYGPSMGWDVDVLSVDERDYDEPLDQDLVALIPTAARITRVRALSSRFTRRFGVSDLGIRSYRALRRALVQRCETDAPQAIYIPGGPFYTFLLGAEMHRRFGVPYVLDYTDPWIWPIPAEANTPRRKAYWSHLLARMLERKAVQSASLIFGVSEATVDEIRTRYPEMSATRFAFAPYGFDAGDFEVARARVEQTALWNHDDGLVHIVYVGVMWDAARDTLSAIFGALAQLRLEGPAVGRQIRLHFVGTTYDPRATSGPVMGIARAAGVGDAVTEHHARVPYTTALSAMTEASALLAFGGVDPTYTSSKIFPTILARRPILAVYHERSSVCSILQTAGVGDLVTFSDDRPVDGHVASISEAFERVVARAGETQAPRLEALVQHSAESGVRHLLRCLDASLASGRELAR